MSDVVLWHKNIYIKTQRSRIYAKPALYKYIELILRCHNHMPLRNEECINLYTYVLYLCSHVNMLDELRCFIKINLCGQIYNNEAFQIDMPNIESGGERERFPIDAVIFINNAFYFPLTIYVKYII